MNLFFVLLLLIAGVANSAEFETSIGGEKVTMYYEDGTYFKPKFTLYRWGEEESLTIEYSEAVFDKCEIEDDKYKAEGEELELEAYGLGDEFKMEIILHEKPESNVLVFNLTNWENFNFWYQGMLDVEDLARGAIRPDNVIGSYAVYHKTKSNHAVGGTNYMTGKAFHIYRPKFIDDNGAWVWADLNITGGVYTVTIPQAFLDTAVYPIKANDTFGKTAIGGSNLNGEHYVLTSYHTASSAGTGVSMHAYVQSTGDDPLHTIRCHLYEDTDNLTTNGETEVKDSSLSAGWITFNFDTAPSIAAQQYLLAVWIAAGEFNGNIWYDDASLGDGEYDYDTSYWNLPTGGFAQSDNVYSLYCTYTPDAPPAAADYWSPQLIVP